MYLITRPNLTATREQVLEDIWPEGDPVAGANSLNQSLFYLRREIDPWYEDDVSHDYIHHESELLWLDGDLVRVASHSFLADVGNFIAGTPDPEAAGHTLERYRGQFCPEFEYEEWAIAWRSRVHAAFLDFAHTAIGRLIAAGRPDLARDVARRALSIDPEALDLERKLVWLYARLGSDSAARAQYQHHASQLRRDGFDPPAYDALTGSASPS